MRYAVNPDLHRAIFGEPERAETPGRSRRCKTCGDWHRLDKPWPHNCRQPAPPRNPNLATPLVTPPFEPFRTGATDSAEMIQNRQDKREFMKRRGLVEFDAGVTKPDDHWTREAESKREVVRDIKRFIETDPLAIPPDLKPQRMDEGGSLEAGTEINVAPDIEVVK